VTFSLRLCNRIQSWWRENLTPGKRGDWGILALVVIVLLVIISWLLLKTSPSNS